MAISRRNLVVAAAVTGILLFLSTGARPIPFLTWIAPAPLLLVLPSVDSRRAVLAGFAAGAIGALNVIATYPALPPFLLVSVILLLALPWLISALLWSRIAKRSDAVTVVIAYAAVMTASEYAISKISPHGTFGSIAYSQSDALPLIQVVSLTGVWGLTFLLSLVPAAIAVVWQKRGSSLSVFAAAIVAGVPIAAALVFGYLRLRSPEESDSARVGLAASDSAAIHFGAMNPAEGLSVIAQYTRRIDELAIGGARIAVLPEKFVGITPAYADSARRILSNTARARRMIVVAGLNALDSGGRRNVALTFGATGRVIDEFEKVHLIGGLESGYRAGNRAGIVEGTNPTIGIAICKDLDFPVFMRKYATARIGLLLVPAWDFTRDAWLHSRMAMLRGVEGGYAIARTATNGRLTLSDAYGRVVMDRSSGEKPEMMVTASVGTAPVNTLYARYGDWFPLACLASSVLFLSGSAIRRIRRRGA